MNSYGFAGSFYKITEWIMTLAYVNILWFFLSSAGFIAFGIFPATISMFTVLRKLILKETDVPILRTFWITYKQEFFKNNLLRLIIVLIGFVFYVDYLYFNQSEILIIKAMLFPFLALSMLSLLTLCFIFPMYVHFNTNLFNLIKNAFLIILLNPILALIMALSTLVIYILIGLIPGVVPFFGVSLLAFFYMYLSNKSVNKIERMKNVSIKNSMLILKAIHYLEFSRLY